jgi:hypothetical protein
MLRVKYASFYKMGISGSVASLKSRNFQKRNMNIERECLVVGVEFSSGEWDIECSEPVFPLQVLTIPFVNKDLHRQHLYTVFILYTN